MKLTGPTQSSYFIEYEQIGFHPIPLEFNFVVIMSRITFQWATSDVNLARLSRFSKGVPMKNFVPVRDCSHTILSLSCNQNSNLGDADGYI